MAFSEKTIGVGAAKFVLDGCAVEKIPTGGYRVINEALGLTTEDSGLTRACRKMWLIVLEKAINGCVK